MPFTLTQWNKTLDWLLEPEPPGVRYLALRDLVGLEPGDPALIAARDDAHARGPIAAILAAMHPDGYWVNPGPGYNPKYRSGVWSIIALAQLGANPVCDPRISAACEHLLTRALAPTGQFTMNGAPSGTIDCLQGNLCWALTELGCTGPRLDAAYEWMARTVTGEGLAASSEKDAPARFYAYKCGPCFSCGANAGQPCAWGGAKVMLAFSRLPEERRTPTIRRAIQAGADFFFSSDPAQANYPSGYSDRPSGNWWKFGFPVFYVTDLLQVVEALTNLGYGADPRLQNALEAIHARAGDAGRWPLEYDYTGKTWVDYGPRKQPNPWVTLRALRVLQTAGGEPAPPLQGKP